MQFSCLYVDGRTCVYHLCMYVYICIFVRVSYVYVYVSVLFR